MIARLALVLACGFVPTQIAIAADTIARIDLALDPIAGTMSVVTTSPTGLAYTVGPFSPDDDAVISIDGSFVPARHWWVPRDPVPEHYRLTISVPPGQVALASAAMIDERQSDDGYRAVFEGRFADGVAAIFAGPYAIVERDHRPVRLRTYFYPGDEDLARPYLDQAGAYIDGYAAEIGAYPYPGFAIVSAPLPVGLGFPGIAYVSRRILAMPFMRTRSLAHEVLHNWWGNGIRPDYRHGNWSEGLTTYMADYRLAERSGPEAAREMRFGWLRDFMAVPAARDIPVRSFTMRDHGAAQAIGYGKVAMIFHMLRQSIGDGAFGSLLREFWRQHKGGVATWDDIARLAPAVDFAPWTERPGAVDLRIVAARVAANGEGWRVTLSVGQSSPFYRLSVPIAIETEGGRHDRSLAIDGDTATATFDLDQRPRAIAIDPDFHLFRRLAEGEAPPILRDVMLDDRAGVVTIDGHDAVRAEAVMLARRVLRRDVAEVGLDEGPAILIGLTATIRGALAAAGLAPIPEALANRGSARAWAVRRGDGTALLIVAADDSDALGALARPLPHYGGRSYVVFDGAKAIDKGLWPARTDHALRHVFD
ncbi:MAG: M1 family aminopeptidase [Alphaproteobacteria bacterium]